MRLFNDLKDSIIHNILERIPHIGVGSLSQQEKKAREAQKKVQIINGAIAKTIQGSVSGAGIKQRKIGRNEIVKIEKNGETKEIKFKKAEFLIETDGWRLVL